LIRNIHHLSWLELWWVFTEAWKKRKLC